MRAAETGALAAIIFDSAEGKPVRDDVRNRVAARIPSLGLDQLRPWPGSLAPDPVHKSAYFIAVDGVNGEPWLLRIAAASTPATPLYPNPLLIGRMRAGMGPEVVVNAVPFGPGDFDAVRRFAEQVDTAFLPRPQSVRSPFAVASSRPGEALPGAFQAFRYLLRNRGVNQAVIAPAGSDAIRLTESAAIWAAIRAGWREGFALELEADPATLEQARGYTNFVAPAEMQEAIAQLKAGAGTWKRFDPDPAVTGRTARLTHILDRVAADGVSDAILEFA